MSPLDKEELGKIAAVSTLLVPCCSPVATAINTRAYGCTSIAARHHQRSLSADNSEFFYLIMNSRFLVALLEIHSARLISAVQLNLI